MKRMLDAINLFSIQRMYLTLKMCLCCIFRLFVFTCLASILPSNFEDEIPLKGGRM